jgi:hypothetical protein
MVCDNCHERDAVVNLTTIENNAVRQLHLCEQCAAERGVETSVSAPKHPLGEFLQAVQQQMDWKSPANATRYGRYLLAGIPLDLGDLFSYAYKKRARVHSNSWGGGDPGAYDSQCEQLDRFVWEHKDFCILFPLVSAHGTKRDKGQSSGEWVSLGTYELPKGTKTSVTITNKEADGYVVADAILFVKVK